MQNELHRTKTGIKGLKCVKHLTKHLTHKFFLIYKHFLKLQSLTSVAWMLFFCPCTLGFKAIFQSLQTQSISTDERSLMNKEKHEIRQLATVDV